MSQSKKLSLFSAILININIMLGSGIFINTSVLTRQAGSLGALAYPIVGLLLLPLIMAIAQLLRLHGQSGTFYDFGRSVTPFFGFISSWSYFTAKLCSAALGIHVCLSFLQKIIPTLQAIPLLTFDALVIVLFTLLNLLNLKFGRSIQYSFIIIKLIPVLFVIITGLYVFQGASFNSDTMLWSGIPLSIPLVLFAFSGFEASCSLSTQIQDHQKNGPRAIFISFAIILALVFLYQLLFYGALGMSLGTLTGGYLDIFPAYLSRFALTPELSHTLQTIFHIAIATSSLGSAYGIMYSNSWNLHTLGYHNHTFAKNTITKLNEHGMPLACVFIEGALMLAYILISQGNQIPLQQVSALGGTIAYTLSAAALFVIYYRREKKISALAVLSLASCALLMSSFVWAVTTHGPTLLLMLFFALLIFGSFMFYKKSIDDTPLEIFEDL